MYKLYNISKLYNTSIYWVVNAIKTIYGTIKVAIDHSIAWVKNWVGSCGELKKEAYCFCSSSMHFLGISSNISLFLYFFPNLFDICVENMVWYVQFSFTISDPVHFEVKWISIPSSVNMWASSIAVFQQSRSVFMSQGSKILFFINLVKLLAFNVLNFKVTIITISSVCNNSYDGRIRILQEGVKH